ncbi:hypothetical protein EV649_5434 [Kribbella sp. VKM Ac-2569]|uniref:hypothetical protein n=1 Tax=Kribbella sp. VKM Ac-2569 TaxID=2512220 RepID=UPI00102D05A5|nr:hypothetical protein [Kribbella sp. VKM Ac-2569]RZT14659.1 hypothetical protein EV649_5434 [Kribbella sp. VKM Ac-2569]
MVHPDPDPKPAAAADSEPVAETEAAARVEAVAEPEAEKEAEDLGDEEEAEPTPDPEKARNAAERLMWTSAWLTVLVGVFLLSGMLQADGGYNILAWLGAVVAISGLLALIAAYAGCALNRITLRTKVVGPADLFQVSTLVVVIVVICGLLVPTNNSAALAILLPWAVTYWLHGLTKPSTT